MPSTYRSMRWIPLSPSALTVTRTTPLTVLPGAGAVIRGWAPGGGAGGGAWVVVVGPGRVVVGPEGGLVVVVTDATVVVGTEEGGGAGPGAGDGAPGRPGGEVGPGWQPPLTVTNGLMVLLLPLASSWNADPPLWTRTRVPDTRFSMENWVPDSCDSTKSMTSGARCSLPVERATAGPVWPLNTVQKNSTGSRTSSATWSKAWAT